jgi:hypothetical protein
MFRSLLVPSTQQLLKLLLRKSNRFQQLTIVYHNQKNSAMGKPKYKKNKKKVVIVPFTVWQLTSQCLFLRSKFLNLSRYNSAFFVARRPNFFAGIFLRALLIKFVIVSSGCKCSFGRHSIMIKNPPRKLCLPPN